MTKLPFTTTTSRPDVILPPTDEEPTALELQRWEDDGGAVPPDEAPAGRARRPFSRKALDQVAA